MIGLILHKMLQICVKKYQNGNFSIGRDVHMIEFVWIGCRE
jgi:hypothetical protein